MVKRNSDPFLAQTTAMLLILLVMFVVGGDFGTLDHLLSVR
jgi:hypothetical protein